MHFVLLIVVALGALLCIVAGLLSVLRDLLERGPYDSSRVACEPSPAAEKTDPENNQALPRRERVRLNLDLSGDFHDVVGRQIESIDQLHRIAVKKREQRHSPPF